MPDVMTIAGIALKTSLVVVATGLLSVTLRRQSAAFNHVLWAVALALCVLMPLAVLILPSHHVATFAPTHSLPRLPGREWVGALLIPLWLAGSSIVLIRELLATIGLARWLRHARPLVSTRWAATLARISAAHGFDRRLRVLESEHIASPCTWGVMRPVLLLPTAGDAWPESARYAALMHELAHVQRRDALSTLLSRLACALHWYNPLVWLAAERVRTLQERSCDDAVLRAGATPSDYAQFLLDVATHTSGTSHPARTAIGMTHCSTLRARIVAILDPQATRSQQQRARLVAACASLFVLSMLLASGSVAIEPPPPPRPTLPQKPTLPTAPALPAVPATPAMRAIPAVPPTLPGPPVQPVSPTLL